MITFTLRIINQVVRGYLSPPKINANKTVDIAFRCYPVDIDGFLHMNNSNYLQAAELSRWRTTAPILSHLFKKTNGSNSDGKSKGLFLFLAAENRVKYIRPINPFQRYIISTSIHVDKEDDKWIYYRHVFEEHPDDIAKPKPQEQDSSATRARTPMKFAVVDLKAVVKEGNGKTIKPSTIIHDSKYFQEWVSYER
jgi:acyl-CoA thioesterase FadM